MNRLCHFVSQGMHAEVESLISQGANVNSEVGNLTPLDEAVHNNDVRMVEILIKAGADVNHGHPKTGKRVLHAAVTKDLRIMEMLLAAGADVEGCKTKDTPLCTAAAFGNREAYDRLIAAGANPMATRGGVAACETIEQPSPFQLNTEVQSRMEGSRSKLDNYATHVKKMMEEYADPDEYAAHRGRNIYVYSFHLGVFSEPDVESWAKRLGEIILTPGRLAEVEERYLSGSELEQARRERKSLDRYIRRQKEKEARIAQANEQFEDDSTGIEA